jgi:hypothetical protein
MDGTLKIYNASDRVLLYAKKSAGRSSTIGVTPTARVSEDAIRRVHHRFRFSLS